MTVGEVERERAFSDELEEWLRHEDRPTLGALGDVFAERSFAVTAVVLMFVPALPAPTGGVTHVFEILTMGLGAQMMLGRRTLWLPGWAAHKDLGKLATEKTIPFIVRRIRTLERFSRPRLPGLFESSLGWRFVGLLLFVLALGAVLAPPFTGLDTLPSLGAMAVALSIILGDVVVLAIGTVIGGLGCAMVVAAGAVAWRFAQHLL